MKAVRWAKGLEALLRPIDSVKPHPNNPNNGDVDSVIESIKVNGFNQVITIDEKTGYIEAGHTRWAALHALGSDVAPFVYVDHDAKGMARYLVADNQTGRKARMDEMQLAAILTELRAGEMGLTGSGFTDDEYIDLVEKLAKMQEEEPDVSGDGFGQAIQGIYEISIALDDASLRNNLFDELNLRFPGKVRWIDY